MHIEVKTVNELSDGIRSLIEHSQDSEFGNDPMVYARPEIYILGFYDGEPATQVGLVRRTITVGQKPLLIGGVGFLVTEPEMRSRGLATTIMNKAAEYLKHELGVSFGLLTCKPHLESLYNGLGWRTVAESTVFVQPTGMRGCGGLTMIHECGETRWPDGLIDLCGLPW